MPYVRCDSCRTSAYIAVGPSRRAECPHCGARVDLPRAGPGDAEGGGHGEQAAATRTALRKVDDAAPQDRTEE